jgi:flagellin-like protein
MKKTWTIRKDAKAVSPVIATILMVAITVVLAAVLYVMVLGFNTGGGVAKGVQIQRAPYSGGYQFTLTPTEALTWEQVTVVIQEISPATASGTWSTLSATTLGGGGVKVQACGVQVVDGNKFLNVTDLSGNGELNTGDYMTITGSYTSGHVYKVVLLYKQDGSTMGSLQWTA